MKFDGNRLKDLRTRRELSLEKLAKMCKTSKSYIWELENNTELEPSGAKIFLLSQALNVPMDYFYGVDLDNTKKVLGTLINWICQSAGSPISFKEAETLLNMLNGDNP